MNNSPKDYLTDRVKAFRKQFDDGDAICGHYSKDGNTETIDELVAFLTETIQQSMEVGRNEYIAEQLMQEGNPTPYIGIDTPDRKLKKAIERVSSSQQSK